MCALKMVLVVKQSLITWRLNLFSSVLKYLVVKHQHQWTVVWRDAKIFI